MDYQSYYNLHSKLLSYKANIDLAKSVIDRFLDKDLKFTVNISGGKDSTVLMHLCNLLSPGIKMVSEKDDLDYPNEKEYLLELKSRYNLNLDIITPDVNLLDVLKDHDFLSDIHSRGKDFSDKYFYNLLSKYQTENKVTGIFIGLRAEESKKRKKNFQVKGHIYQKKDEMFVCQPIAHLTVKDIFAYLFSNDIPIFDIYFKTNFVGSPENIRKSWILPSFASSKGQALWLKYYYPEQFNILSKINPEIRCYI